MQVLLQMNILRNFSLGTEIVYKLRYSPNLVLAHKWALSTFNLLLNVSTIFSNGTCHDTRSGMQCIYQILIPRSILKMLDRNVIESKREILDKQLRMFCCQNF